jgi:hypothetical protein
MEKTASVPLIASTTIQVSAGNHPRLISSATGADCPYSDFIEENVCVRRLGWQTDTGEDSVLAEKYWPSRATVCSRALISRERMDTFGAALGLSFGAFETRFRIDADNSAWTAGGGGGGDAHCQARHKCQAERDGYH